MGPETYYAAGILAWYKGQEDTQAYVQQLREWAEPLSVGSGGRLYLPDDSLFDQAIKLLEQSSILELFDDPFGPDVIEFKMDYPHSYMADSYPNSAFGKAERFGRGWIERALLNLNYGSKKLSRPSEDDSEVWAPLQLERSDQAIQETISGAEGVVAGIKSDNGFASEMPGERDNLVNHAEATLQAAKDGVVTKRQVREHLVNAGKWLGEKFSGTAIGTLGTELVKWGLRLLGLL